MIATSISTSLLKKIRNSVKVLKERAESTGGPEVESLYEAFMQADHWPEFDADPSANYEIGWLRGVAEVLECDATELLDL